MKKKLPYGLSDFRRVITEDYYYIDKTNFIEQIEKEADFLFFLRPRRFGKSLTISMLEYYFDIYYKDEFEDTFKNTYILENPTPLRNSFYMLRFDFNEVDITDYETSFRNHIDITIDTFCKKYNLPQIDMQNPINKLNILSDYCSQNNLGLYVLIDEYDSFMTELLINDVPVYESFFTMLKVGTSGAIKKMFFTGVSPLALYDVTSGSNIGKNISLNKVFNDMVGITKSELIDMINFYGLSSQKEHIIARANEWYNSYKFHEDIEHTIYNSDMILYYLDSVIRYDEEPRDLIDVNVRTDYSKLKFLVYSNQKLNGNFEMLNNLILGNKVTTTKGFVTIEKYRIALNLKIPNQTLKKLLAEFIDYAYKDFEDYNMQVERLNNHRWELVHCEEES